jgi:cobalt-precorrin 5A hydrolase
MIERGVDTLLGSHGLCRESVREIASVDVKADEPALLALSERRRWPLRVFPALRLDSVSGIQNPSETVKRFVGTRGVAEPAALAASGAERLLVPKQVYTEPGVGRSMTFAVARVPFPERPSLCPRHP